MVWRRGGCKFPDASLPQKLTTQDNGELSSFSFVPVFVVVTAAYPSYSVYMCVCVQRVCD